MKAFSLQDVTAKAICLSKTNPQPPVRQLIQLQSYRTRRRGGLATAATSSLTGREMYVRMARGLRVGYVEEEQGAASNELAQKVVELGTEGVGTAAWMHARWHGAAGPLIVLRTDTEEQRQTVYELTGVLVAPLDFEAAHTVGQSATQSTKWMQQKTRRTLNFNPLFWVREPHSIPCRRQQSVQPQDRLLSAWISLEL
jgi:hypothetical protein